MIQFFNPMPIIKHWRSLALKKKTKFRIEQKPTINLRTTFMKYLIISDIHEDLFTYQKIINRHTDIDYIIICGDTVLPRKYYQNDKTLVVAGNCDFDSSLPLEIFTNIFEKKRSSFMDIL